jgi:hypothetical protein
MGRRLLVRFHTKMFENWQGWPHLAWNTPAASQGDAGEHVAQGDRGGDKPFSYRP